MFWLSFALLSILIHKMNFAFTPILCNKEISHGTTCNEAIQNENLLNLLNERAVHPASLLHFV